MCLFFAILLGIMGQMCFKNGVSSVHSQFSILNYSFNKFLLFGIILYGISTLFYITALKSIPLSIAYPSISLSYVIIIILSHYFFNERISFTQICGSVLIICGVILLWKK